MDVKRPRGRPKGGHLTVPDVEVSSLMYTAGFFDGEGSVMIIVNRPRDKPHVYYRLVISISSTDLHILEWFANLFGGTVRTHSKVEGCKQAWVWRLEAGRAERFLQQVRPYLKIKHQQADLGMELQSLKNGGRPTNAGQAAFHQRNDEIRRAVCALNKRGDAVSTI